MFPVQVLVRLTASPFRLPHSMCLQGLWMLIKQNILGMSSEASWR